MLVILDNGSVESLPSGHFNGNTFTRGDGEMKRIPPILGVQGDRVHAPGDDQSTIADETIAQADTNGSSNHLQVEAKGNVDEKQSQRRKHSSILGPYAFPVQASVPLDVERHLNGHTEHEPATGWDTSDSDDTDDDIATLLGEKGPSVARRRSKSSSLDEWSDGMDTPQSQEAHRLAHDRELLKEEESRQFSLELWTKGEGEMAGGIVVSSGDSIDSEQGISLLQTEVNRLQQKENRGEVRVRTLSPVKAAPYRQEDTVSELRSVPHYENPAALEVPASLPWIEDQWREGPTSPRFHTDQSALPASGASTSQGWGSRSMPTLGPPPYRTRASSYGQIDVGNWDDAEEGGTVFAISPRRHSADSPTDRGCGSSGRQCGPQCSFHYKAARNVVRGRRRRHMWESDSEDEGRIEEEDESVGFARGKGLSVEELRKLAESEGEKAKEEDKVVVKRVKNAQELALLAQIQAGLMQLKERDELRKSASRESSVGSRGGEVSDGEEDTREDEERGGEAMATERAEGFADGFNDKEGDDGNERVVGSEVVGGDREGRHAFANEEGVGEDAVESGRMSRGEAQAVVVEWPSVIRKDESGSGDRLAREVSLGVVAGESGPGYLKDEVATRIANEFEDISLGDDVGGLSGENTGMERPSHGFEKQAEKHDLAVREDVRGTGGGVSGDGNEVDVDEGRESVSEEGSLKAKRRQADRKSEEFESMQSVLDRWDGRMSDESEGEKESGQIVQATGEIVRHEGEAATAAGKVSEAGELRSFGSIQDPGQWGDSVEEDIGSRLSPLKLRKEAGGESDYSADVGDDLQERGKRVWMPWEGDARLDGNQRMVGEVFGGDRHDGAGRWGSDGSVGDDDERRDGFAEREGDYARRSVRGDEEERVLEDDEGALARERGRTTSEIAEQREFDRLKAEALHVAGMSSGEVVAKGRRRPSAGGSSEHFGSKGGSRGGGRENEWMTVSHNGATMEAEGEGSHTSYAPTSSLVASSSSESERESSDDSKEEAKIAKSGSRFSAPLSRWWPSFRTAKQPPEVKNVGNDSSGSSAEEVVPSAEVGRAKRRSEAKELSPETLESIRESVRLEREREKEMQREREEIEQERIEMARMRENLEREIDWLHREKEEERRAAANMLERQRREGEEKVGALLREIGKLRQVNEDLMRRSPNGGSSPFSEGLLRMELVRLQRQNTELMEEKEEREIDRERERLQEMEERERPLLDEIDRLKSANEQLARTVAEAREASPDGMLRLELMRLQRMYADATRHEADMASQLRRQETFDEQIHKLQEENEELHAFISKIKQMQGSHQVDLVSRLFHAESELQDALEANSMYREQLKTAFSDLGTVHQAALQSIGDAEQVLSELSRYKKLANQLENDLQTMCQRYADISLKLAEVETDRNQIKLRLRNQSISLQNLQSLHPDAEPTQEQPSAS